MNSNGRKKLTVFIVLFILALIACIGVSLAAFLNSGFLHPESGMNFAYFFRVLMISCLSFAAVSVVLGVFSVRIKQYVGIFMLAVAAWNILGSVAIYILVFRLGLIPV